MEGIMVEYAIVGFLIFSTLFFLASVYGEKKTMNDKLVITGWALSSILGVISLVLYLVALNSVSSTKIVLLSILSNNLLIISLIVFVLSVINTKRLFRSRERKRKYASPKN